MEGPTGPGAYAAQIKPELLARSKAGTALPGPHSPGELAMKGRAGSGLPQPGARLTYNPQPGARPPHLHAKPPASDLSSGAEPDSERAAPARDGERCPPCAWRRGAAAMAGRAALRRSVVSPAGRHRASVILLHGSGDTGPGLRAWIKQVLNQDLVFQHIKVIYPTAPARPYTPMRGALSTVWFDRWKISNDCPEHIETIDSMCQVLTNVIDDEVKNGISKNRIILGGFSMGGGMAMHLAYRCHQDVAGVFALSSFLNKTSAVYQALQKNESVLPELFQCHGTADELVLHSWGEETNKMLNSLGVATSFHSFPNLNHELHKTELEKLSSWIVKKLPVETAMSNE